MQIESSPMYVRPVIIQEMYDIVNRVNEKQTEYIEDHGYANTALQGMYNAVLSVMSILSMTGQPLENLYEASKRRNHHTLEDELQDMLQSLQNWCNDGTKSFKGTRENYETIYEGLIALAIKTALEHNTTLKFIDQYAYTETEFIVMHIHKAYSQYQSLLKLTTEAITETRTECMI